MLAIILVVADELVAERPIAAREAELIGFVRQFFDAISHESHMTHMVAGDLHDWFSAYEASSSHFSETGQTEISDITIAELSDRTATVEISAEVTGRIQFPQGFTDHVTGMSGPVSLTNLDGAWKVTDYFMEGSSVVGGIFRPHIAQSAGSNVRLEPVIGWRFIGSGSCVTHLYVNAFNEGPSVVGFSTCLAMRSLGRYVGGEVNGNLCVAEPGQAVRSRLTWATSSRLSLKRCLIPLFDEASRRWSSLKFEVTE